MPTKYLTTGILLTIFIAALKLFNCSFPLIMNPSIGRPNISESSILFNVLFVRRLASIPDVTSLHIGKPNKNFCRKTNSLNQKRTLYVTEWATWSRQPAEWCYKYKMSLLLVNTRTLRYYIGIANESRRSEIRAERAAAVIFIININKTKTTSTKKLLPLYSTKKLSHLPSKDLFLLPLCLVSLLVIWSFVHHYRGSMMK